MKNNLKEIIIIIKNFIKPTYIKDEMLKTPKEVKKLGIKIEALSLIMTIISLSFAFLLKLTNALITSKIFFCCVSKIFAPVFR